MKSLVNSILSKHTGKTEKQIAKDTDRDNFMDAEEALKYGLIDQILEERVEALENNG
jgi:Protease subunit of ATP-dependent Clp proteases